MRDVSTTQSEKLKNSKISCYQCELFDSTTNKCGVFQIETASRVTKCHLYTQSTLLDEIDCMINKDEQYPNNPSFTPNIPNVFWYISPELTFGCWIINKYKRRFLLANLSITDEQIKSGVYQSIIPLHKHPSANSLRSHLAWYINEAGEGKYVLINKYNEIIYIK